ncbi:MAG: PaaI family thioesterase [Silicimonas sp.]|nr:PaaI family thioesterase [Silicimonas sp.]NNL35021.1 PaaI family thioesterase [Silicimonas sp.]RZW06381.1 MAG: PaaI family thioesterase [Paracoccaceae bacterium]
MSLAPDIAAKVRASFARQTMMRTLGAELVDLGHGTATISAPILPTSLQQQDAGHAALTFAIGDSAAGYSALTLLDPDSEVMTVEMKINLLRPALGDLLVAEGRVIKPGRRVSVVAAEVFAVTDGVRKQIALLQGTMIPV